jgi:hypothetical protein
MKRFHNIEIAMLVQMMFILLFSSALAIAQDQKYKARLSVEYHKIMGSESFILVNAKFKGENGYEPATGLALNVYYQLDDDSLGVVGEISTDQQGYAKFLINEEMLQTPDSVSVHEFVVKIENSDRFKDGSKSEKFSRSNLYAEAVELDSVYNISAKLTDEFGNPLEGQKLKVMVHRLFAPLTIGKSSYKTDDDGTILVPIEEPLPGVNGILTFEVMLDSRKYGIVSHVFDAPIGTPVVDQSTFDQRTMWSPPSKTPVFLWVFANMLILGVWLVIIILIRNLYRIYKI